MSKYTYVKDPRVKEILELAERFRECLKYPNSENSGDECRYTEHFEAKIKDVMKRKVSK